MRLGVVDLLVSGLDVPLAPRCDDLHLRREALDGQLEADLVVALAGRAVRDGIRALGNGDLRQLLADDRSCKGSAQQVGLVLGIHLHGRDDHVVDHLVDQIGHDQLACAGLERLLLEALQLIGLTDIAGHRDDLGIVVILFQPGNDDGRVKAAGIGQNDFLDLIFIHNIFLRSSWGVVFVYALIIHQYSRLSREYSRNIQYL